MPNFNIGKFKVGMENSQITSEMVTETVDDIQKSLMKIPRFAQLMDLGADKLCEPVFNSFPDICMNNVEYSQPTPNENIINLKKELRERVLKELDAMANRKDFNRNKMFNYYTDQYDYFFYKDLELIKKNIWKYMTTTYYDHMYTKFNKLASNPWNNAKTKDKQQAFKNDANETDKLTFTQTYNPIPDCFI